METAPDAGEFRAGEFFHGAIGEGPDPFFHQGRVAFRRFRKEGGERAEESRFIADFPDRECGRPCGIAACPGARNGCQCLVPRNRSRQPPGVLSGLERVMPRPLPETFQDRFPALLPVPDPAGDLKRRFGNWELFNP